MSYHACMCVYVYECIYVFMCLLITSTGLRPRRALGDITNKQNRHKSSGNNSKNSTNGSGSGLGLNKPSIHIKKTSSSSSSTSAAHVRKMSKPDYKDCEVEHGYITTDYGNPNNSDNPDIITCILHTTCIMVYSPNITLVYNKTP